jgi:heme-degrading monooxygenase HmoA
MYLRIVKLRSTGATFPILKDFYVRSVLPVLRLAGGCRFAGLLQSTVSADDVVSLTLWETGEHAEAYEREGLYDRLLDQSEEVLEASEDAAQPEGSGAHRTVPLTIPDPPVEAYTVELVGGEAAIAGTGGTPPFVRMVSIQIADGRVEEFRRRFNDEVVPVLEATRGCRRMFLVGSVRNRLRALSVTVWDSEADSIRYEASGVFEDLARRLEGTFSPLYRRPPEPTADGSGPHPLHRELDVSSYLLVVGESMEG